MHRTQWLTGTVTFTAPAPSGIAAGAGTDADPEISSDGQTLYFNSTRLTNIHDMFAASRMPGMPFGAPFPLGAPNSGAQDRGATVSTDQLFFDSSRTFPSGIYTVSVL